MTELEFRRRDYIAEDKACYLSRAPAESHPLSTSSQSHPPVGFVHKVKVKDEDAILDPLRGTTEKTEIASAHSQEEEINLTPLVTDGVSLQFPSKEWTSLKKTLFQKFPVANNITLSSISQGIMKVGKVTEQSQVHSHFEERDDPQKISEEGLKVVSQKEYITRLQELKHEISHSWDNNDRVTSLRLSIKVARLLMDTSVLQFYPTIFVLATEVMDMLGDMVWERIMHKAEYAEDGTFICSLPDNFEASHICEDAKETCVNWFSKIGSIRELLPRLYLELALLPCWRFLIDNPVSSLQRLVLMARGIGDPLASAYCHLYMAYRAQKLTQNDIGYLITGIKDLKIQMERIVSMQEIKFGSSQADIRLHVSLMEPTIESMMKCIFKYSKHQMRVHEVLVGLGLGKDQSHLFGDCSCVSIILHHLLKELPVSLISSNAMDILHMIKCNDDCSYEQYLNYKLVGLRLCESISQVSDVIALVEKIMEVISCYDNLDEYLTVLDAFFDIILHYEMDIHLNKILDEVFERVCAQDIGENALTGLQSFFLKLLTHFDDLKEIVSLNHFIDILDVMHGSSRNIINVDILRMATKNNCIQDHTIIHFLFEVSQALHDGIDSSNIRNDENQHSIRLISGFVNLVDYGENVERNLSFLLDCRGAFTGMNDLKETLVHSSNLLAVKALKYGSSSLSVVKSCLTFSEVTIPSIPDCLRQLNLYLETAEIALLCELLSHADGLIGSAICCLQDLGLMDGLQTPGAVDGGLTLLFKLCNLIIRLPGGLKQGFTYGPRSVYSFLDSSWMTSKLKVRGFCALISMLAALSQNPLQFPSIHNKVISNYKLFFSDPTYLEEISLLSGVVLEKVFDVISQEPSQTTRGNLALEFCNCIASSFKVSKKLLTTCAKLVEIAELSLGSDNRYLASTKKILVACGICEEENMDLEVVGRHALLFDDDPMAAFVNSGDALVDWNSLQIDRYDVRHLLSGPLPPRRRRNPQSASNTADSSLSAELDHERYLDLPSPSDEPEVEEAEKPDDATYHAVGFSYGNTDELPDQNNAKGGLEGPSFRPPFNVPESLVHSLPPTEKVHEIIARTATFVSKHGGQSEIILRVKQGDNPTFGFLMPNHNLHAYYRFLVEHPEVLQSESDAKSQSVDANANQAAVGAEGALSLLGSVYGSGEDDDSVMEDAQEFGNVPSGKMNADSSAVSHVAEKADFSSNAASKDEVVSKHPLHSKDKPSTVKKNPSISMPKVGRTNSLNTENVSGSRSSSSVNLGKALILEPPPDLKILVEKIVDFITKNGKQFEASLREQDSKQGRFPFLVPSNQYHPYYLTVLKKAESNGGPDKKVSSHKEDNSELSSDMPFESDRKEKFKMVIAKSKKESQDHESKPAQQEHGISIDAEAAAAILQAGTRGFKNPFAGIMSSSSLNGFQPQVTGASKQGSDLGEKSLSDKKAFAKIDISETPIQPDSDPPLTKEQKLKAERLKRAKMFVAMLKGCSVPSKDESSRALSVEPSELGVAVSPGKADHGTGETSNSALVDCTTSDKIENGQVKVSMRKYRSRSEKHEENDDEEMEGNHLKDYERRLDDEEKSHRQSRKKHHSSRDSVHDSDYRKEKSHKRSRKRDISLSSFEDNEEKSTDSSLHRHTRKVREKSHKKSSKRHRSRSSSYEDDSSAHRHSSKRHSSHRHKHEEDDKRAEKRSRRKHRSHRSHSSEEDDERTERRSRRKHRSLRSSHGSEEDDERAEKHSRRKHRSHRSSHSSKEKAEKSNAHSSESEGSELGHHGGNYSKEEKRSVLGRAELEEGEISPKVSDQSKSVGGPVSREASADVTSTNGRAASQPSETIHISDDLRAKVRAMLMTSM
ncbi:OLC1v1022675C1 [Oldenlandia corymbosa var. corymbosa]|uniref:OLC1v1022675C1 n=1 Tax=Oldenlandia corymbosa var. corymbosa TaxID=529605 RepID=A0AAV1C224_OLDCO|nr:OLC1v1022675C1 [Oldenlandia corymbosa var. corymbosa]